VTSPPLGSAPVTITDTDRNLTAFRRLCPEKNDGGVQEVVDLSFWRGYRDKTSGKTGGP